MELEHHISYFLLCTIKWTPRWFNKPKFHIIRHLAFHIGRFGPAILFATESFESFNAVVRGQSIHSNRHAPSKDIATGFAHSNRVHHVMSGGVFQACIRAPQVSAVCSSNGARMPPVCEGPGPYGSCAWRQAGPDALALV